MPTLGFRGRSQPLVANGLKGLPGNLEHHENILPLEMRILTEDIIHTEASVDKL